MSIKLIGTDLDGTLLDKTGHITEETKKALKACADRGIRLAIVSGRCFEMTYGFGKEAGTEMILVCCNGSRIETGADSGEPAIVDLTMDDAVSKKVYEVLTESGLNFVAYRKGYMYVGNPNAVWNKDRPAGVHDYSGRLLETITDEKRVADEVWHDTYKYVVYSPDEDVRNALRNSLSELDVRCESSWWDNLEIMRSDIDKGSALLRLAEYYGIKRDEVMAFGDNYNDVAMLKAVGWPVVMENGVPEVKKLARIVAPSNIENGVADTIYRYVLNGEIQ